MSDHHLSVAQDFAEFKRGDKISDPDRINQIQASEHASFCRKVFPTKLKTSSIDTGKTEKAAKAKRIDVAVPKELIEAAEDAAKKTSSKTEPDAGETDHDEHDGDHAEHDGEHAANADAEASQ